MKTFFRVRVTLSLTKTNDAACSQRGLVNASVYGVAQLLKIIWFASFIRRFCPISKSILSLIPMERKKAGNEDLKYFARTLARQAELSQQTVRSLAESSSTVNLTNEEFRGIGGLLNQSRVILTKYGRREITDKFLIVLAVIFFYSCVFYIVSKRFIQKITY